MVDPDDRAAISLVTDQKIAAISKHKPGFFAIRKKAEQSNRLFFVPGNQYGVRHPAHAECRVQTHRFVIQDLILAYDRKDFGS